MAIATVLMTSGSKPRGRCPANYIGLFDMSIVIKATTDLGGGAPFEEGFSFLNQKQLRLAHPCVFCKGGLSLFTAMPIPV